MLCDRSHINEYVTNYRYFSNLFYKGVMILMPVAGVSMIVVIIIAVIMAMMQIQEQTLTFYRKWRVLSSLLSFCPWMFQELTTLILDLFDKIPSLLRSY